ncbi:type II toxin-antitoxin system VapC family toxin [Marmoricola sp. RAF53]|uniref:type II toxin-antitoxin system VapC family toxin n=1 Tax=Marmoricola sp. RAF53 TaxID=3233059 RepID=UPI003F9D98FF
MIVLDNSAAVSWLVGGDARSEAVAGRVRDQRLVAPELIDLEAASALRRLVAAGTLSVGEGARALQSFGSLGITRMPHVPLLPRIWELRDNLTPYDAAYVALAEGLGVSLLTLDARLARAPGIRCAVELIS